LNSNAKNLIATIVGVILIAGVLTVPLAFEHQSADARNVKVKSVKNTIKNIIQAIMRAAGTGNDGISSDGSSGTGTNGNPGSSTNGVPGTEGSRGIVIALPGVDGISDSTGAGGASGASGIGCIGASCNGGAGAAGGAGGSNFGQSGSVSGGAACQQVVSGAQACSTGTGGSANGGLSRPGGVGGLGG
jgi:hypothetical protein